MKRIEVVAGIICSGAPTKLGAFAVPGQKFLATQRGYGEFKDGWEFPGGKMEPGESREMPAPGGIRLQQLFGLFCQ